MSDETIEQPTKIKTQDFDVVHKQIALEQKLNKLTPFIAYKTLLHEKERTVLPDDPTTEEQDWHDILDELLENNEYGRSAEPEKPELKDWLSYYNYMFDQEKDFDWLFANFKYAGESLSRDDIQSMDRYNAIERVIREKKQEFPDLYLSYQERNNIKIKGKKCDDKDIGYNNQKRLYYLKLNNQIRNGKEYKKLSRKEKKDMIDKLKDDITKINKKENAEYKDAVKNGIEADINKTKEALQKKLEKIGFSFKVVTQGNKKDGNLNNTTIGSNKNFNFFHTFGENPSIDNFLNANRVIDDECPNILDDDMHPFLSEDPSEMGGHPGAFINIYIPKDGDKKCTVYGGKKWQDDSRIEYNFYQYIYNNKEDDLLLTFKKYIPEYIKDKKCMPYTDTTTKHDLKKMDYYFPIANIKNIVRKENETIQTADFKIGYRTSFLHEKGYKGNKGGVKRDKYHSISNKLGFRLEGSNLIKKINKISRKYSKLSGWHTTPLEGRMKKHGIKVNPISKKTDLLPDALKKKFKVPQFNLYILNPGFIFDTIFYNQTDKHIKDFQRKLRVFEEDFIKKNFDAFNSGRKAIAFIGSSFFFVSGRNGIDFKLIDFAHPYILKWNQRDGKRLLSDDDDICCPTYLKDGKIIPGRTHKDNKMAVKYDYKKKVEKKKINPSGETELIYSIDKDENKRNLTYKEWEHTFFNFMNGLLSMIYSFHFWANTRLNYKQSVDNIRKREIAKLREKYLSYKRPVKNIKKDKLETWMDLPDNIDPGNAEYEERIKRTIEETWDEPYLWDEDSKMTQLNELIINSQSNLLNAPL